MAGGTFDKLAGKVRPGTYINFVSTRQDTVGIHERGTVVIPLLNHNYGPVGEFIQLTSAAPDAQYSKLGYSIYDEDENRQMLLIREAFKNASTVYVYRANGENGDKAEGEGGGVKAAAKYAGSRGNSLTYSISQNPISGMDVEVHLAGDRVALYEGVPFISDLIAMDCPYIDFTEAAENKPADEAIEISVPKEDMDVLGIPAGDLQSGLSIVIDGKDAYLYGTLPYIEKFERFDQSADKQEGNYVVFNVPSDIKKYDIEKNGESSRTDIENDGYLCIRVTNPEDVFTIKPKDPPESEKKISIHLAHLTVTDKDGGTSFISDMQPVAGVNLEGGTDGDTSVSNADVTALLDALERIRWNTLAFPTNDVNLQAAAKTKVTYLRESVGRGVQVVMPDATSKDYEGIISVTNSVKLASGPLTHAEACAWVAGATAAASNTQSNTYVEYEGAEEVVDPKTHEEAVAAINAGEFFFSISEEGAVVVEYDINSLTSFKDGKDKTYRKNRVIRVFDTFAEAVQLNFPPNKFDNSPTGWAIMEGIGKTLLRQFEDAGAIMNVDYDADFKVDQNLSQGDETYFNVGLQAVDSAEKLYFTIATR